MDPFDQYAENPGRRAAGVPPYPQRPPTLGAPLYEQPPTYSPPPHRPPRRRRGLGYRMIIVAGFLGGAVLAGAVGTYTVQEIQSVLEASQQQTLETPNADADDLASALELSHDGIRVDWEAGPQLSAGLDQGHRITRAPGVLLVDTLMMQGIGVGTGMILSSEGLAITNYHVVENSSEVTVTVADTGRRYTAQVLGRDAKHDVAVLQIDNAGDLATVSIDTDVPRRGDLSAAIGNGSGQGYLTAVTGDVIGLNRSIMAGSEIPDDYSRLSGLIETDADVVPGYSGGPMVDSDGQVIGVTTAASRGSTTDEVDGYAIPITVALDVVEQVLTGEETETVSIGADGALGIIVSSADGQAVVEEVSPNSSAETLGLRPGDVVLRVDGVDVSTAAELADLINAQNAGDTVFVEWRTAAGESRQGEATLQEAVVN